MNPINDWVEKSEDYIVNLLQNENLKRILREFNIKFRHNVHQRDLERLTMFFDVQYSRWLVTTFIISADPIIRTITKLNGRLFSTFDFPFLVNSRAEAPQIAFTHLHSLLHHFEYMVLNKNGTESGWRFIVPEIIFNKIMDLFHENYEIEFISFKNYNKHGRNRWFQCFRLNNRISQYFIEITMLIDEDLRRIHKLTIDSTNRFETRKFLHDYHGGHNLSTPVQDQQHICEILERLSENITITDLRF